MVAWHFPRELGALYKQTAIVELPRPTMQYADYVDQQVEWLGGAEAQRQRAFWRGQLAGDLPSLRLNRT